MKHPTRQKAMSVLLSIAMAASIMSIISSGGGGVAYAIQPPDSQPLPNDYYYRKETLAPYGTTVQVDELKNWSPDNDPDARFNRSRVPIAERRTGPLVNPQASEDAQVLLLAKSNGYANTGASQGGEGSMVYAFTNYQYVDVMNYWGGSKENGCIAAPTPEIIDAAHRNGAKCTGTIFLVDGDATYSTAAIGQMVEKVDGRYPFADKLIEMAEYYGFDGWFINAESSISSDLAARFREMLAYIQENKPEGFVMEWYDSMQTSGGVLWQNAFNSTNIGMIQNGDTRYIDHGFMNFDWTQSHVNTSISTMAGVGRSQWDVFATWENFPYSKNSGRAQYLYDADGKVRTSLGIYTPNITLAQSLSIEEFQNDKELAMWSTNSGDPRDTARSNSAFPGFASLVADKTVILGTDFVTNFNAGSGYRFYEEGAPARASAWYNRSLTDVMPTWRWMVDSTGSKLQPEIDYAAAWYGGSSIKVSGKLDAGAPNHVMLYSTYLDITDRTVLDIVYRESDEGVMKMGLCFGDSYADENFVFYGLDGTDAGNGWKTASLDLSGHAGETAIALSLQFASDTEIASYSANVGKLAVSTNRLTPTAVGKPAVDEVLFSDSGHAEARLSWTDATDAAFYKVYRLAAGGGRTLLNVVNNNVFYAPRFSRLPGENDFDFEIVPINEFGDEGAPARVNFNWEMPENSTEVAPEEPVNLAFEQPAVSREDSATIGKLTDGLYGRDNKWEGPAGGSWAVIDLGSTQTVGSYILYNANCPDSAEDPTFNTSAWSVWVAPDDGEPLMVTNSAEARSRANGLSFTKVSDVTANTEDVTYVNLDSPTTGRYVKINVTGTSNGARWPALRIPEMEVYANAITLYSASLPLDHVKAVNNAGANDVFEAIRVPAGYTVRLYQTLDAVSPIQTATPNADGTVRIESLDFGASQGRVYFTVQDNLGTGNGESLRLSTPFDAETIDPIPEPVSEMKLSARAASVGGKTYGTAVLRDVPAGSRAQFFQNESDTVPMLISGVARLGQFRSNQAYIVQERLELNPAGGTYYVEIYKDGYRVSDRFAISYDAPANLSIDATPLEEAVAAYRGKTWNVYTPASWAAFQAAMDHAADCLDDPALTRDEMHAAIRALTNAANALVLTAEYYPITPNVTEGYGTIDVVSAAQKNDTVTVRFVPAGGYELIESSIRVATSGQSVAVTTSDAVSIQFTMPGEAVTVSAGFRDTAPGPDGEAPTSPGNVRAESITKNSATIRWNASSDNVGVTGYRVYRGNTLAATVTGGLSSLLDGLAPGTQYTVAVTAVDAAGNESNPGEVRFTTLSNGSTPPPYYPGSGSVGTVPDVVIEPPTVEELLDTIRTADGNAIVETTKPFVLEPAVLSALKEAGKTLTVEYKDRMGDVIARWTIDGKRLTDIRISTSLSLWTAELGGPETRKLQAAAGSAGGLAVGFSHEGALPGSFLLDVRAGSAFAEGDLLNLYYYNPAVGKLEIVADGLKVEKGFVRLTLDHCSEYVLTKETVPGAAPALPAPTPAPQTNDPGFPAAGPLALAALALCGGVALAKRREKQIR